MTARTLQGPARRATGAAGRCYRAGKKTLRKLGTLQRAGRLQAGRYSGPCYCAHCCPSAGATGKARRGRARHGNRCGWLAQNAGHISGARPQLCCGAHSPASQLDSVRQASALRAYAHTDRLKRVCVGAVTRLAKKAKRAVPLWQTDVNRREDVRLLPVWPCS